MPQKLSIVSKKNWKKFLLGTSLASILAGSLEFETGWASSSLGFILNHTAFLHSKTKGQFCQYVEDYDKLDAGLRGKKRKTSKADWYEFFPDTECINRWPLTKTNEVIIKSADGSIIARRKPTREYVSIKDMPEHIQRAFIAREDRRFYQNRGIDWHRKGRVLLDLLSGRRISGASGINEQVAKWAFTSRGEIARRDSIGDIARKFGEVMYATELDHAFDKEKILEFYLNNLPLGDGKFGIATAARNYFSKDIKDLTEAEALFLATVTRNPARNPKTQEGLDLQLKRYNSFLDSLVARNFIDSETAKTHRDAIEIKSNTGNGNIEVSYDSAIKSVRDELLEFGVDLYDYIKAERAGERNPKFENPGFGFTVYTSVETELTKKLLAAIEEDFKLKHRRANFTAVVLDKSGRVIATVGRRKYRNYGDSHLGIEAWVPVASTIKPFFYGVSYDLGLFSIDDIFYDDKDSFVLERGNSKLVIPEVNDPPHNWNDKYGRRMRLDKALVDSNNIIARRVYDAITREKGGFETLLNYLETLGLNADSYRTAGANDRNNNALGGRLSRVIDVAAAYGVWINNGVYYEPTIIDSFEFGGSIVERVREGELVFKKPKSVQDVRRSLIKIGRKYLGTNFDGVVGLKTGTADETVYAWTAGFLEFDNQAYSFAFLALNEHGKSMGMKLYATHIVIPVVRSFVEKVVPGAKLTARRIIEEAKRTEEPSLDEICRSYSYPELLDKELDNENVYNLSLLRNNMEVCARREYFGSSMWSYYTLNSARVSEKLFDIHLHMLGQESIPAQMHLRNSIRAYKEVSESSPSDVHRIIADKKAEELSEQL